MKRIIASIGILLLTAQVALGSAGSLFLCLCIDHVDAPSSCAPVTLENQTTCQHDEQNLATSDHHDRCEDLLLTGDPVDSLDRPSHTLKAKASPSHEVLAYHQFQTFLAPLSEPQPQAARAPPLRVPRSLAPIRTVKLLL